MHNKLLYGRLRLTAAAAGSNKPKATDKQLTTTIREKKRV